MKILVTGGAGFIGSNIVDRLINLGYKVIIIDDLSTGKERNINPSAKFYKLDIQNPQVEDIFRNEQLDIVNHHAAQMDVRKSVADPMFDTRVNVLGSINLLQLCVQYNVKKFVFASSGGCVYGEQKVYPAPESHPTQPICPYGINKLSIEHYLHYYWMMYNLNYTVLRYANIYGPGQDPWGEAGVVAIFINKLLKNEQPIINGDGKQTRDYTYVDDVVEANILAINSPVTGIFNIGTGLETSVNELFSMILKTMAVNVKEVHGPAKDGETSRSCVDGTKANLTFGWQPKVSFEDGIKQTVKYFEGVL
ncbi:MAG: NAD-dependent epimerase/dehydratase family protein [bacterium]|nr:NAD-dependent epimerase/dehydratase family protein [bacterium]